ncbi:MAG: hypothetical protein WC514_03740, partial [Candidatus Paceibacterota bacterium]
STSLYRTLSPRLGREALVNADLLYMPYTYFTTGCCKGIEPLHDIDFLQFFVIILSREAGDASILKKEVLRRENS